MAEHLKLRRRVYDRPQSHWKSIAVELLGCQIRFVQGEKYRHRILEKGDGPPLFLYHGVGGHIDTFARILPMLAKDFHVYAVDALYHGYSSKEPWDTDNHTMRQAEAYVDLLHALGYERAHFQGESMGAVIGLQVGLSFPETLDKIILNGGFDTVVTERKDFKEQPWKGALGELSRDAVLNPTFENVHRRLLWLVHDDSTITEEMVHIRQRLYQDPEVNASMRRVFGLGDDIRRIFGGPHSEEYLRTQWKTPALVLWGTYNPGNGPDYGEYCADLIGAKFYEVKDTGHWPQWEKPDEYVEAVTSFLLDGQDGAAS